jgi:hypothetical protein
MFVMPRRARLKLAAKSTPHDYGNIISMPRCRTLICFMLLLLL